MFTEILILILCVLAWRRWRIRRLVKLANELKSDIPALPLIGHSYLFIGNDERWMQTFERLGRESIKQGDLVDVWHGHNLFLCTADPVIAEFILKNCLEKHELLYNVTRVVIGNGHIFAPVSIWRPRRKVLVPNFSTKNLLNFMMVFKNQSNVFADLLRNKVGKGDFSIWDHATTYTMDSVCETTLGVKVEAQKNPGHSFLPNLNELLQAGALRLCQPWFHSDCIYYMTRQYRRLLHNKDMVFGFVEKIIDSKRKLIRMNKESQLNLSPSSSSTVRGSPLLDSNAGEVKFNTFLELMIESSGGDKGYTNLELQEESLVLIIAGTDTTAVAISFTIVMLSKHSTIQDKVYQEIVDVFGDDSDRSIKTEDLSKLRYLGAVIKETMRLYPPVPIITRTVEKDIVIPTGVTLPKGCAVLINIWAIHRNPKYWGDDAESFRPERFIDTPLKHPSAFMPFSNGPRGCLGYQYAIMSMKTVLTALLRRYRVLPAGDHIDTKCNDTPLRTKFNVMMRDVDNYRVRLELRK